MIRNYFPGPLDLDFVYKKILEAVDKFQTTVKNEKNVVIFDIDDTLICSFSRKPVPHVIDFFDYLDNFEVNKVLITARSGDSESIKYTLKQLEELGIKKYSKIYFRPPDQFDISYFKKVSRKTLIDDGFIPIMSVGDMHWDVGDFGGYPVLLRPHLTF